MTLVKDLQHLRFVLWCADCRGVYPLRQKNSSRIYENLTNHPCSGWGDTDPSGQLFVRYIHSAYIARQFNKYLSLHFAQLCEVERIKTWSAEGGEWNVPGWTGRWTWNGRRYSSLDGRKPEQRGCTRLAGVYRAGETRRSARNASRRLPSSWPVVRVRRRCAVSSNPRYDCEKIASTCRRTDGRVECGCV